MPKSLKVEPLSAPLIARQLVVSTNSTNTALTPTCQRISIKAIGTNVRFMIGNVAQTASSTTSHYIEYGERLDFAIPLNSNIAVIRDSNASNNGVLEVTELG